MCLVVFAWKAHPDYRLIVIANRDEFHARPTEKMHWWPDQPDVLAGRDLQAGGTWLGIGKTGRFATVTNYREQTTPRRGLASRGELATNFIGDSQDEPYQYNAGLNGDGYAGFSLLTATREKISYVSNRGDQAIELAPGVFGLSNASLDTPWSKLVRTKAALGNLLRLDEIDEMQLLQLMADRTPAAIADVETGLLPFTLARAMTSPFILTPEYGTRCTSLLMWDNEDKIIAIEKRFDHTGETTGTSRYRFDVYG